MVTGVNEVKSAVECMKLGALDYLQKPFTPVEFLSVIRTILEGTRPGVPEKLKVAIVEDDKMTRRLYELKLAGTIWRDECIACLRKHSGSKLAARETRVGFLSMRAAAESPTAP